MTWIKKVDYLYLNGSFCTVKPYINNLSHIGICTFKLKTPLPEWYQSKPRIVLSGVESHQVIILKHFKLRVKIILWNL